MPAVLPQQRHPKAPGQGLSPDPRPTDAGNAQVSPWRLCPKSVLSDELHTKGRKLQGGKSRSHRGLSAAPEDASSGMEPGCTPRNSLPCLFQQLLTQAALPAVPLKHSPFPKLSRPAGTSPTQTPSLETALESELPFPLIHPIVFLHFLPHKTPLVHPFGCTHIHCKHRARFGRKINSKVSLWVVICPVNREFPAHNALQAGSGGLGTCLAMLAVVCLGQKLHFAIC